MGYDLWLVTDLYDTLEFSFPTKRFTPLYTPPHWERTRWFRFYLFFGYWFDINVDIEGAVVFVQSELFFHFN